MEWPEVYGHLAKDPNDQAAHGFLGAKVAVWASRDLSDRTAEDREDVVAEACAMAVIKFSAARGPDTFLGFVKGHYLNARNRLLQVRRANSLEEFDPPAPPPPGPTREEREVLRACLENLSDREREAVEMKYLREATHDQIARALNITTQNARVIVFRGLARLRECVRSNW